MKNTEQLLWLLEEYTQSKEFLCEAKQQVQHTKISIYPTNSFSRIDINLRFS